MEAEGRVTGSLCCAVLCCAVLCFHCTWPSMVWTWRQVETALAFDYKSIAEKHITNSFHSAFAYVTSLLVVHIPFSLVVLAFFFK